MVNLKLDIFLVERKNLLTKIDIQQKFLFVTSINLLPKTYFRLWSTVFLNKKIYYPPVWNELFTSFFLFFFTSYAPSLTNLFEAHV